MATAKSQERINKLPMLRHSVTLVFNLTGDGKGDEAGAKREINIPFFITEVTVKQVTSRAAAINDSFPVIKCAELCGGQNALCSVPAVDPVAAVIGPPAVAARNFITSVCPNTTFMVYKSIEKTTVEFRFDDLGAVYPCTFSGSIALTLEFRGHK